MKAQRHSGRRKLPPELKRTVTIRMQVTVGDAADLQVISEGWNVPIATAAYAMVATELASARSVALDLGGLGLEFASAIRLLSAQRLVREQGKKLSDVGLTNAKE